MSLNYQYIIISANEERQNKTNELLNKVNTNKAKIYNLQATIPSLDDEFINCIKNIKSDYEIRVACCTKSHLRALEYALNDNSPEFSIILEDDVTFIKDNFCQFIDDIINKMKNHNIYKQLNMIHIGYILNSSYYEFLEKEPLDYLNKDIPLKSYISFYAFGAQGYIVRKSAILNNKHIIQTKNINDFYNIARNIIKFDTNIISIDYIINRIFLTAVIYPPLIIERNEQSLIGHTNQNKYWEEYFNKFPEQKEKYLL